MGKCFDRSVLLDGRVGDEYIGNRAANYHQGKHVCAIKRILGDCPSACNHVYTHSNEYMRSFREDVETPGRSAGLQTARISAIGTLPSTVFKCIVFRGMAGTHFRILLLPCLCFDT